MRVLVYSGLIGQTKFDAKLAQPYLNAVAGAIAAGVSKVAGPNFTFKPEVKGSLALKGQWRELKTSPEAYFSYDISLGFDPLIGIKVEIPVVIPPLAFIQRVTGAAPILIIGGGISAVGTFQRAEAEGVPKLAVKGGLGGKLVVGLGLGIKDALVEASVTGETGISVKGSYDPTRFSVITAEMNLEGLVVKSSVKFAGGLLKDKSFGGQITVLEPAPLFKDEIDFSKIIN
jgi:hypothetical protein